MTEGPISLCLVDLNQDTSDPALYWIDPSMVGNGDWFTVDADCV